MNNKCLGCGATIQTIDSEKIGYAKEEGSKLCVRCFRINNYGEYKQVIKDNTDFIKILEKINETKDLVILLADLFFLNENFDVFKKYLKDNPILLVLTKRDLLPKSIYEEKLLEYMDSFNLNVIDKIIISKKNYHFDLLLDLINKYKKSKNVYVVGYTNAGKSTMINHLIYNYSDLKREITTSMLPSTTLNEIVIPLNDELTIIDTPGILDSGNIIDYVDTKTLKKILPKKEIKPITYQVKSKNYFWIEDLIRIDALKNTNLTFFISNELKLERTFKEEKTPNLKYQEFVIEKPCDIVILGLGFIKVSKKTTIGIWSNEKIKIYIRKSLI